MDLRNILDENARARLVLDARIAAMKMSCAIPHDERAPESTRMTDAQAIERYLLTGE